MPLHVICPGCLKRFQVSERFAGKQGPCPNCAAIISIPKEAVSILETDGTESNNDEEQRVISPPLTRIDMEFDPVQAKRYMLGVLGVLLLAFLLGCIPMYAVFRSLLGLLGLCLVAFPMVLFGYHFLRDREQIFAFTGEELYRRTGTVAAGYVILWFGFEYCLAAIQADLVVACFYFSAFAVLATLLCHPLLQMNTSDAFLHYGIFAFSVVFLRFLIGLGWFWTLTLQNSTAPILPGMQ